MLTRRSLLAGATLLPAATWAAPPASAAPGTPQVTRPEIRPRSDWATATQPVRGTPGLEEDVRFLLVHHTLTPNEDPVERIPQRLRSIYAFHTGEQRGWIDVAYNFFVDSFGVIWEGREGSVDRAVRGDATGGSQGFALLCCFVGDFTAREPTAEAMAAMTHLLAWLASREGLDLVGTVEFVSRGSSKWRKGTSVITEQVAAHRDMSLTECPGHALYPLVGSRLLPDARTLLAVPTIEPATPEPTLTAPAPTGSAPPEVTAAPAPEASGSGSDSAAWLTGGAVTVTALVAATLLRHRARRGADPGEAPGSGTEQPHGDGEAADQQDAEEPHEETRGGA